jgi:hypothetical protein
MLRTLLGFVALTLLGLFLYFYVKAPAEQPGRERARQAVSQVGDTVRDEGVAGLIRARLAARLGIEGTRYLHVQYDAGQALVYGLIPPETRPEEVAALVQAIPGISAVDVQVLPRPAYLAPR